MAQINITLNQEEIQQLLMENRDEAFKKLFENALNSILKAESCEQLQAEPYERTEERTDSRNGYRDRPLTTRIGRIILRVPRHRNVPFKTMIFDNYSRSEAALIAGMTEMVINGVSTRRVTKVVEALCGASFSKSTVSDLCKNLSENVEAFRNRPLDGVHGLGDGHALLGNVDGIHDVVAGLHDAVLPQADLVHDAAAVAQVAGVLEEAGVALEAILHRDGADAGISPPFWETVPVIRPSLIAS